MHTRRIRSSIIILVVIVAVLIAVFVSGRLSAPEPVNTGSFSDGQSVSLKGELTCLPHRNQSGPQTMECAYGFRDESGAYYALEDTTQDYSLIGNTPMNEPVQIEGVYRTNTDTKYQQNGTIQLTTISK